MSIKDQIDTFSNTKVLVIGDIMLDTYIHGTVHRMSPEAPVPVVSEERRNFCLGGAANVALNLKSLGADTHIISVIGKDDKGNQIKTLLADANINAELLEDLKRPTTSKVRILNDDIQALRVDNESDDYVNDQISDRILTSLKSLIDLDLVILQDYDKGVFSKTLIERIITHCKTNNIFVAVDPKKRHFKDYTQVDLFKPNLREIEEGLSIQFNTSIETEIKAAVDQLNALIKSKYTLLTLADKGIYIKEDEGVLVPTFQLGVSDVSGAGDTVISVAALALKNGLSIKETAKISNLAASIVCQEIGVVPIDKAALIAQLSRLDELDS